MDENKTGVWVQTKGRHKKRLDSDDEIRLSIGDYIQVFSDVDNVLFKVVSVEYNRSRGSSFQKLLPVCSVFGEDDKAIDPTATESHRLIYTKINSNNKMWFDGDLYRYINCVVRTSDELQVVLISGTTNENLEIQTGTISADEIMSELTGNEEEKDMNTEKLKDKIKKVIYVDKEMTVREPVLDSNGKPLERGGKPITNAKFYKGMVKVVWNCGTETVAYTSRFDRFNREEGFKTCVLKYLFGNAGTHDAVDFWTNKYVKYPSSCIEVTENLCKLEEILENDKKREDERKGLPHAKFFREIKDEMLFDSYDDESLKNINEFKKLAKKYFPELKGKEIYINDNKQDEKFVAIK